MKSEKLKTALSHLNKRDLYLVLWFTRLLWLRHKVSLLRPTQMVMPAAILQIVVFVLAALTPEHFVLKFAIGSFIIAAFLMLPLMLRPAEVKMHWVKRQE